MHSFHESRKKQNQGMGQRIERMQRAIKYGAILGGSEEIMGDLGVKMAIKSFPSSAAKL